jgi:hypothetical protein
MRLKIVQIADRGVAHQERLHISVLAPANVSFYVVLATEFASGDKVNTIPKHTYWFGGHGRSFLKPGDNVILYTGLGVNNNVSRPDGGTDYFVYWGLPQTIWGNKQSCAVLLELENWETWPQSYSWWSPFSK